MSSRALLTTITVVVLGCAGCGGSSSSSGGGGRTAAKPPAATAPEVSPSGDIPDSQAYVPFPVPRAGFTIKVPEGWSRSTAGGAVTFTDKLNAIRVESRAARSPLTVTAASRVEVPRLAASVKGFRLRRVDTVTRRAGSAVRIGYLATGSSDAVTGRTRQDAVERYVFFRGGREAVLTLSGPVGADNVDPYRIVTDSLTWAR